MAEDIAPELLKKIQEEFHKNCSSNKELQEISKKVADGTANCEDLENYAIAAGEMLAKAMHDNVSGDNLPDGKMYYNIASRIMPPNLEECYTMVADIAEGIYGILNEKAGIHIKALRPDLNKDRIDGLVNYVSNADQYEDVRKSTEQSMVTFSQSVATDAVHKNADFQYKAGLTPKIRRRAEGNCCKWCQSLEGTYDYADVRDTGNDVWRRHRDCRCEVTYDPGTGRTQNAHSKKWDWKEENKEKVEERITFDRSREQEERDRKIHYGETKQFERDRGYVSARAIENYARNNIYVSDDVAISPREIRWINNSVSEAKNILGIAEQCNIPVVIVSDSDILASYNPRTNIIFLSRKMSNSRNVIEEQIRYAAPDNPNSTMVHELIHWQDAEEYRNTIGKIESAGQESEYSIYQYKHAETALKEAGINLEDDEQLLKISVYAYENAIANNFEEVYTEYRTKKILEG